jgi:uncharacterized protein YqgC (DUF456 family)
VAEAHYDAAQDDGGRIGASADNRAARIREGRAAFIVLRAERVKAWHGPRRKIPLTAVLLHIGLGVFYIALLFMNLLIFVGLPGSWIAIGCIAIYAAATRFAIVGWRMLLVMAGIAAVGEIVESFLGVVYVARKGATKWGVLGAFVGGIVGAIVGTMILPVIGSMIFGFVGAFGGAVLLEYAYYRSLDRAMQTGFFAFMGKLMAMMVKFALGITIVVLFVYRTW